MTLSFYDRLLTLRRLGYLVYSNHESRDKSAHILMPDYQLMQMSIEGAGGYNGATPRHPTSGWVALSIVRHFWVASVHSALTICVPRSIICGLTYTFATIF